MILPKSDRLILIRLWRGERAGIRARATVKIRIRVQERWSIFTGGLSVGAENAFLLRVLQLNWLQVLRSRPSSTTLRSNTLIPITAKIIHLDVQEKRHQLHYLGDYNPPPHSPPLPGSKHRKHIGVSPVVLGTSVCIYVILLFLAARVNICAFSSQHTWFFSSLIPPPPPAPNNAHVWLSPVVFGTAVYNYASISCWGNICALSSQPHV